MIDEKQAYETIEELIKKYSHTKDQCKELLNILHSNSLPPVRYIFSKLTIK